MSVAELNSRFGAPARIVFREGFAGFPNVVIANKYGTAEIALYGGNVLSYRPTGHSPVIFRPAKKDDAYRPEDGFHGGIPVCWPQFGNKAFKDVPQHGFARHSLFEVRGTEYTEEKTEITLGLKSNATTLKIWPHAFDLELKVSVTMKLNLNLTTKNTGTQPFDFSCGFHPYFLLRNRDDATVRGLEGCTYIDGTTAALKEDVLKGDLQTNFAPDHIFTLPATPKHAFAILDQGLRRAIAIASSGNTKCVVWNCGAASPMTDYSTDDWKKYICVEPVSEWPGAQTLAPSQEHTLMVAIQAHLDGMKEEEI